MEKASEATVYRPLVTVCRRSLAVSWHTSTGDRTPEQNAGTARPVRDQERADLGLRRHHSHASLTAPGVRGQTVCLSHCPSWCTTSSPRASTSNR